MAIQAGDVRINSDHSEATGQSSWIKHTEGGELPDTSRLGRTQRRAEAAAAAFGGELRSVGRTWWPMALVVAATGVAAYLLWDRFADVAEDQLIQRQH